MRNESGDPARNERSRQGVRSERSNQDGEEEARRSGEDPDPGRWGLRTILENVLLDTMYELPSKEDVCKIVIDESVINGENQPYMVLEGGEQEQKQLNSKE